MNKKHVKAVFRYCIFSILIAAPVLLAGCSLFDFEEPTVRITSHQDGDSVSSPFLLSGTAKDNTGLQTVEYRIDNGEYSRVDGKESWNILISANAGTHIITIRAVDFNNNEGFGYVSLNVQ